MVEIDSIKSIKNKTRYQMLINVILLSAFNSGYKGVELAQNPAEGSYSSVKVTVLSAE